MDIRGRRPNSLSKICHSCSWK